MERAFATRIRQRLNATGKSVRAASLDAGLSETALKDLLGNAGQSPKLSTIERLALALDVEPAWLAFGVGDGAPSVGDQRHLALGRPAPFRLRAQSQAQRGDGPRAPGSLLPAGRGFNFAETDGDVGAGLARSVEYVDDDTRDLISVPRDPDFGMARQVVYRARGNSMDRAEPKPIQDGDFLICALWEDLDLEPESGMIVAIERRIAEGQFRERTVKELVVRSDRFEAVPRSSNEAHQAFEWPRDREPGDTSDVTILSLVRWVLDGEPIGRAIRV